jgi:Domain of unknown function (DUF397)
MLTEDGTWKTATASNGSGGNNCVEVSVNPGAGESGKVFVRNSKDRGGPMVAFAYPEWEAFLAGANGGEFDLP